MTYEGSIRAFLALVALLVAPAAASADEPALKQLRMTPAAPGLTTQKTPAKPAQISPAKPATSAAPSRTPGGKPRGKVTGGPGIGCPDLQILDIDVIEVKPGGGHVYGLTFGVRVRNLGPRPYFSGHIWDQYLHITEVGTGRSGATPLHNNWSVGQGRVQSFKRQVFSTQLPQAYDVEIRYALRIVGDDNPGNDDCSLGNNKISISGATVLGKIQGQPQLLPDRPLQMTP